MESHTISGTETGAWRCILRSRWTDKSLPDVLSFLRAWASNPHRVGAIAPSGSALADLITRDISADSGAVLELGPGTGVFTRTIRERGVPEENLTLIENGADFAGMLRERFPKANILQMDASRLGRQHILPDEAFGAAVSGLPMLSIPPRQVLPILAGVFRALRADGALYQFTYGPRCPIPRRILDHLGLTAAFVGRTYRNIPPAAVYRIVRSAV